MTPLDYKRLLKFWEHLKEEGAISPNLTFDPYYDSFMLKQTGGKTYKKMEQTNKQTEEQNNTTTQNTENEIKTEEPTQHNLEEGNSNQSWLEKEAQTVEENKFDGERLPALKLEEGKITTFTVDFSKPFDKWKDSEGTIKKIIPVTHGGEKKVFWLNVRNPLYQKLILQGKKGQTTFKVLRTGQANQTRYSLVEE